MNVQSALKDLDQRVRLLESTAGKPHLDAVLVARSNELDATFAKSIENGRISPIDGAIALLGMLKCVKVADMLDKATTDAS
jgi:hypothetical protein